MARVNQDFDLYAGEDKTVSFKIRDELNYEVDLTDTNAIWVLARSSGNPTVVIEKRVDNGGIVIEDNKYNVILGNNDTILLNGKYNYELRMIKDTKQSVVAVGEVDVLNSLTIDKV